MGQRIVLVTIDVPQEDRGLAADMEESAEVHFSKDLSSTELEKVMAGADVLIAGGWRGSISENVAENMPNLKLIQTLAAGVNHVPFSSLPASVVVSSGSGANSREIAEHALALVFSAAKNVVKHTVAMRGGSYPHGELSRRLQGQVLGVLGVGSIGAEISGMASCLGMRVLGCDKDESRAGLVDSYYPVSDLGEFLKLVDVLMVCVPLTRRTEGMIGSSELSLMKRDAILVNISRGAVVREKDIYEHLKANPLFTACLDVWWRYTPDRKFKQNFPFQDLDNVIMTPHNATHSPGQRQRMFMFAFNKVVRYFSGEPLEGTVDPADYV